MLQSVEFCYAMDEPSDNWPWTLLVDQLGAPNSLDFRLKYPAQ